MKLLNTHKYTHRPLRQNIYFRFSCPVWWFSILRTVKLYAKYELLLFTYPLGLSAIIIEEIQLLCCEMVEFHIHTDYARSLLRLRCTRALIILFLSCHRYMVYKLKCISGSEYNRETRSPEQQKQEQLVRMFTVNKMMHTTGMGFLSRQTTYRAYRAQPSRITTIAGAVRSHHTNKEPRMCVERMLCTVNLFTCAGYYGKQTGGKDIWI